jgi:hypothetical protein
METKELKDFKIYKKKKVNDDDQLKYYGIQRKRRMACLTGLNV